jgi:hypothetical protein
VSWIGVPMLTGPAGTNTVLMDGVFGLTVIGSLVHALFAGSLAASPL